MLWKDHGFSQNFNCNIVIIQIIVEAPNDASSVYFLKPHISETFGSSSVFKAELSTKPSACSRRMVSWSHYVTLIGVAS